MPPNPLQMLKYKIIIKTKINLMNGVYSRNNLPKNKLK